MSHAVVVVGVLINAIIKPSGTSSSSSSNTGKLLLD